VSMAHLVHGYRVADGGKATSDTLIPYLEMAGFPVHQHDYGWFGLMQVRLLNGGVAEDILRGTKVGDIGVGHSNGCAILADAADRGAPFAGLIFINPALDTGRVIERRVKWIHVYYNKGDVPVLISELLDWLPWNWNHKHPWGGMGRTGFTGHDRRYRNVDCGSYGVAGHSDFFRRIEVMGPVLIQNLRAA